jgi:hypothetical protein
MLRLLRPLAFCSLVTTASPLLGCSDESATPGAASTQGTTAGGTGGGGGAGGAAPCEPGSHDGPSGVCEASLTSWSDGPPLLERRDHHATFVATSDAAAFLYVLGGVQDMNTLLSSVELAPIAADGSLGAWASGTALPAQMAGHAIATVGQSVVITGGFRAGPSLSKKSEIAVIQPDGSLGPWTEGPLMSLTRFHHAMVSHQGSVYVVGGLTGNNTDNTPVVERAIVGGDGQLGAWSLVTPLPDRRSHHGLAVHEGALFVTAGLRGDPAGVHEDLTDVLRAPVLEDGSLGEWATVGSLPVPLGTHASFAHLGYLCVVGGVENNASNTDHVRRAAIGADGMLGGWEDVLPLPAAHAHAHHTPVHAGFLYSAGGALNHVSVPDVFVGRFE